MHERILFPAFVLVQPADPSVQTVMDLSGRSSLHVVSGPRSGIKNDCLLWFTTENTACDYLTKAGLVARVVSINSPYQALAFLGMHAFLVVALDPVAGKTVGQVVQVRAFLNRIRELTGVRGPKRSH